METSQRQISLFTEEELTSSQVGFLASHTAQQENDLERKMTATSGLKCAEQLEKFSQLGLLAKMFSGLLIGQEGWYSTRCRLTWKLKGTKYSRMYCQLQVSTLPTAGTEFSSLLEDGMLPTPNAVSRDRTDVAIELAQNGDPLYKRRTKDGHARQFSIKDALVYDQVRYGGLLPTPKATEVEEDYTEWKERMVASGNPKNVGKTTCNIGTMARSGMLPTPREAAARGNASVDRGKGNLEDAVAKMGLLPTPRACESVERRNMKTVVDKVENGGDVTLTTLAKYKGGVMLPTPATRDYKGARGVEAQKKKGNPLDTLPNWINEKTMLPTPRANDSQASKPGQPSFDHRRDRGYMAEVVMDKFQTGMLPTPATRDYKGARSSEALEAAGRNETNSLPDAFHQTGTTSQLNPLFVAEMMNFPPSWTVLPFLNGGTSPSVPTEMP
jgi:hypothetical protein